MGLFVFTVPVQAEEKALSYEKDIKPLFKRSCSKCHGEKKQKGELRLDSIKAILKGGENGKVVVAGDAEKSKIYTSMLLDPDDDEYMPVKGEPLNEEEIALVKRWINKFLSKEIPNK